MEFEKAIIDMNIPKILDLLKKKENQEPKFLHFAANFANLEIVKIMIQNHKYNPHSFEMIHPELFEIYILNTNPTQDEINSFSLFIATNYPGILLKMLKNKIIPTGPSNREIAKILATSEINIPLTEFQKHGIKFDFSNNFYLIDAILKDFYERAEILIDMGANVNTENEKIFKLVICTSDMRWFYLILKGGFILKTHHMKSIIKSNLAGYLRIIRDNNFNYPQTLEFADHSEFDANFEVRNVMLDLHLNIKINHGFDAYTLYMAEKINFECESLRGDFENFIQELECRPFIGKNYHLHKARFDETISKINSFDKKDYFFYQNFQKLNLKIK